MPTGDQAHDGNNATLASVAMAIVGIPTSQEAGLPEVKIHQSKLNMAARKIQVWISDVMGHSGQGLAVAPEILFA